MSRRRYVAIHGHFYQPPRENPWLETVEVQDSAAPFHDWNARVTGECYAPNSAARRVDAASRITDIVNNFERLSFNVGPTLLSWLEAERPEVYARILEADRVSAAARGGHGNAIAQPYHHAILPLCSRRDKVTQVRWGLADFRQRFGREPEGMWLPEAAVDRETLEVLAEHGVGFTILAPRQAARVREGPGAEWRGVGAGIDPSRPYRFEPDRGRGLALFFFDGPISHAVAFEGLLHSGDAFAARLLEGFDERRPGAQLVHVATDGESYGHHEPFGEMALAAACDRLERTGSVTLTNHGAFLAAFPPASPAGDVEIVEGSSWSCVHGVERWRGDCGCNTGRPGWHQRWRAPLREALDWLRDEVDALFEARTGVLLKDPWAARDDYVHVVLDRSRDQVAAFFDRHQLRPLMALERVQALRLLELERHRLLMYTSCGWFFDEISGVETVQVLRYAARVVQLARELGGDAGLEAAFLRRLAAAPSNLPELGTGDVVYRRHALPAVVDLRRVIAHYAITAPYEAYGDEARIYAYAVERLTWQREAYGETSLAVGRVRASSRITAESEEATVAVLHFGGHDFHCAMRTGPNGGDAEAVREDLFRRFAGHGLAEVVRALDDHFEGRAYGIRDLFLEERRRLLALVTDSVLRRFEETYRRLYEDSRRLMQYLREADAPQPDALALAARYILQRDVEREIAGLAGGSGIPERGVRIRELAAEARSLGIDLGLRRERSARHLEQALLASLARLQSGATREGVDAARTVLELGRELGVPPDLWAAQNRFFLLWKPYLPSRAPLREPDAALASLATLLGFEVQPG